jgi:hypothetical protein
MSSLQDLAAEYGIDGFEYDQNEPSNEHAMDWVNEDLHGFLDDSADYSSLHPGTRSHRLPRSGRARYVQILLWRFLRSLTRRLPEL